MKLYEVQKILEEYAPLSLSDEYVKKYSAYDNSGIIFDFGGEIEKAVCALDFSSNAVNAARTRGGAADNNPSSRHIFWREEAGRRFCKKSRRVRETRDFGYFHASEHGLRERGHRRISDARSSLFRERRDKK